ncbi:MAG: hypothetical protein HKO54_07080 [Flavobacteriaceae bacterium]|nr:hypothetical protein [Flavobacteriaceae bacterium]
MERQVGIWKASNSEYMNENETDDAYAIEWKWGVGQKSLLGILFGMKNGERTNDYWQFVQFWDSKVQKVRVLQIAMFGVYGEGFLERIDASNSKVVQTFVTPDGHSYSEGHTTQVFDNYEVSISYEIKEGEWIKKRTYTWHKQN